MIENLPHTWEQYPIHSVGNYFQKHSQLSFLSVCRLRPKKTIVFLDAYIAWENNGGGVQMSDSLHGSAGLSYSWVCFCQLCNLVVLKLFCKDLWGQ